MFLTWSVRPFLVFNLVSQTLIVQKDFEKSFMVPCFLVIMSPNDNALAPSTSAASPCVSIPAASTPRYSPSSKLFHCGQGTCDYSSKVKTNGTRHQKSTCLCESREEWKLRQRTCQQCGQVLMQAKFMKKHQLTKYCVKQRELKKRRTIYKFSK